ncbi:hypothetical protein JZ751_006174, partial [Albula glossodonta]
MTIHRLGARTLIRTLETELRLADEGGQDKDKVESLKKRVTELSIQSGVSMVHGAPKARMIPCHAGLMPLRKFNALPMMSVNQCLFLGAPSPTKGEYFLKKRIMKGRISIEGAISRRARTEELMEDQMSKDPLLQLISLQKASGSWDMGAELAELCGKTMEEAVKHMPAQADRSVWATVLALLWLYGFKLDYKEEWQFVAMKAVSWIRAQTGGGVSQCVQAGNTLLGLQLQEGT